MLPARILYVSTVGDIGGGEACLLRLMAALDGSRFTPILAAPRGSPLARRASDSGIRVVPLYGPAVFDEDRIFDLTPVTGSQGRPRWQRRILTSVNYARVIPAALALAYSIIVERVDLVHANTPRAAMTAGLAARITGRRAVTHVRDIIGSPFHQRLKRWLLARLTDRFVAASEATAAVISGRPTVVVYDGLAFDEPAPIRVGERTSAPRIGMVAHMSPWKGHQDLIRAVPHVLARFPGAEFAICGGDFGFPALVAYRSQLEAEIQARGLAERVRLVGRIEDVPKWLAGLDVFVHPPSAPDPFPGAVLEACVAGCPIVATGVGGILEMVEDGVSALLVPPSDSDALARAIVRLLDDRGLARRLAASAQHDVRRFSLIRTVDGVCALYEAMGVGFAQRVAAGPELRTGS